MIEEIDDTFGKAHGGICDDALELDEPSGAVRPGEGGNDPVWRSRRHRLRWLAVPAVVAVFGLSVALAKGLHQPQFAPSPLIGRATPAFTLQSLTNGPAVDSSRLGGQVVVVNFWASWCVPCRQEASTLERFARRNAGTGVELIGVLYSDTRANALDFRDEFGLTYPLVDDPDGATAIDFGVRGVPETFVIGSDGRIMARLIGAVGPTTLDDVVQRVLAGQTYTSKNDQYRTGPNPTASSGPSAP